MISPEIEETIRACAREFNVKAVWIFGSSLEDDPLARDIDLALEGIPPEMFFKFYARLFMALPKPVDLVDLSQDTPIASVIRAKGVSIYER
jgi:predicted nucleotidyltransferase